ncbi:LPXTG-motif protein cell wall anchor domain protein [Cooperia oncophora]
MLILQLLPIRDNNTTLCTINHQATVTFTHRNGSINGAYISYVNRTVSNDERQILLTVRTRFLEYRGPSQKSRFELQRGRFHCPSDVTCWRELWLPLTDDVSPSTVPLLVCAVIVVLCFILALVKRRRKLCDSICDCQFAMLNLSSPLNVSKKTQ